MDAVKPIESAEFVAPQSPAANPQRAKQSQFAASPSPFSQLLSRITTPRESAANPDRSTPIAIPLGVSSEYEATFEAAIQTGSGIDGSPNDPLNVETPLLTVEADEPVAVTEGEIDTEISAEPIPSIDPQEVPGEFALSEGNSDPLPPVLVEELPTDGEGQGFVAPLSMGERDANPPELSTNEIAAAEAPSEEARSNIARVNAPAADDSNADFPSRSDTGESQTSDLKPQTGSVTSVLEIAPNAISNGSPTVDVQPESSSPKAGQAESHRQEIQIERSGRPGESSRQFSSQASSEVGPTEGSVQASGPSTAQTSFEFLNRRGEASAHSQQTLTESTLPAADRAANETSPPLADAVLLRPENAQSAQPRPANNQPVFAEAGRMETQTSPESSRPPALAESAIDRIGTSIVQAVPGGKVIRMRVHPPELGVLAIEVISVDGKLIAKMDVENLHAHRAILENLPQLQEMLHRTNAAVDRIELNLLEPQSEQNGQQANSNSFFADREQAQQQREFGTASANIEQDSSAEDNAQDPPGGGRQRGKQISRLHGIDIRA